MASTYLTRTSTSTGNRKIGTLSMWVKRGKVVEEVPFGWGSDNQDFTSLIFNGANQIELRHKVSNSYTVKNKTNRLFRDLAAWYHIVYQIDTTQAVESNRLKLYVNGEQITSWAETDYPTLNEDFYINLSGESCTFGRYAPSHGDYFAGSMAHVHWIDGTAYDASAFGETDSTSGIWIAKTSPSVTYGTNGFFLKFQDTSAFGDDSSGNNNDFTVSGTMTQTKDNPDNNFSTLNSLETYYTGGTFSNGNNTFVTGGSNQYAPIPSSIGMVSGKWYWEVKPTARSAANAYLIGIFSTQTTGSTQAIGANANDYAYYSNDGNSRNNNSTTAYGDSYDTDDVIGVALDLDNNKLYFSKNGTWQNSGVPTSGATGTGALSVTAASSTTLHAYFTGYTYWDDAASTYNMNYGNGYFGTTSHGETNADDAGIGLFKYDVPAGYYALCTNNLGDQS
jgi:hypothetical protein